MAKFTVYVMIEALALENIEAEDARDAFNQVLTDDEVAYYLDVLGDTPWALVAREEYEEEEA